MRMKPSRDTTPLVAGISPNTPDVNAQFRSEFGMQAVLLSDPDRKIRKAYDSLRVFGGFRTAYLIDKSGVVRGAHEYVCGGNWETREEASQGVGEAASGGGIGGVIL